MARRRYWIAICTYLLALIATSRLNLASSPQILLNLIEVKMFERINKSNG